MKRKICAILPIFYFVIPLIELKNDFQTIGFDTTLKYLYSIDIFWKNLLKLDFFFAKTVFSHSYVWLLLLIIFVYSAMSILNVIRKKAVHRNKFTKNEDPIAKKAPVETIPRSYSGWFPPNNVCRDYTWWFKFNEQQAANIICNFYGVPTVYIIKESFENFERSEHGKFVQILGTYEFPNRVVTLYADGQNEATLLHELFHHLNYFGQAPLSVKIERAADAFAKEILIRSKLA
jgi:hypothetical protein